MVLAGAWACPCPSVHETLARGIIAHLRQRKIFPYLTSLRSATRILALSEPHRPNAQMTMRRAPESHNGRFQGGRSANICPRLAAQARRYISGATITSVLAMPQIATKLRSVGPDFGADPASSACS